ncbi:MAG: hypothetical protein QOF78_2973 [Phycisphaerales bacterium]|jgi:hypothetical protein|nr:hypothetical protein [Phycisphaerales bacterium]
MRNALLVAMVVAVSTAACGEREADSSSAPPAPTTQRSSASTRFAAATAPTTAATMPATTRFVDPLTTPTGAITYMFAQMKNQDVHGVRAMMADPMPPEKLRGEIRAIANRLNGGAKWEIVDTRIDGVAAIVLFRTTLPDGTDEVAPLVFVNRYDRWKVLLGPLNLRKFTDGEKDSMNKVLEWGVKRLSEIRGGAPATAPSTAPLRVPGTAQATP